MFEIVQDDQAGSLPEEVRELLERSWSATSLIPSARTIVGNTSAGSPSGARSTKKAPRSKAARTWSIRAMARRVLPVPPGPVECDETLARPEQKAGQLLELSFPTDQTYRLRQHVRARRAHDPAFCWPVRIPQSSSSDTFSAAL